MLFNMTSFQRPLPNSEETITSPFARLLHAGNALFFRGNKWDARSFRSQSNTVVSGGRYARPKNAVSSFGASSQGSSSQVSRTSNSCTVMLALDYNKEMCLIIQIIWKYEM